MLQNRRLSRLILKNALGLGPIPPCVHFPVGGTPFIPDAKKNIYMSIYIKYIYKIYNTEIYEFILKKNSSSHMSPVSLSRSLSLALSCSRDGMGTGGGGTGVGEGSRGPWRAPLSDGLLTSGLYVCVRGAGWAIVVLDDRLWSSDEDKNEDDVVKNGVRW